MHHLFCRRSLMAGLIVLAGCATRPGDSAPDPDSWRAAEAAIRAATHAAAEAWNRGDLRGHLAMYADTTTFMTQSGPQRGVDAIEDAFSRPFFDGGEPKQQLRFEDVVVRSLGSGAALETGRFILSGGGQPDHTGWFTLVWVRTPQGWRVVHDHSS